MDKNDLGEFNLFRMVGASAFIFLAVSAQFSRAFHLSMKMSVSLVEIRQLNSNFFCLINSCFRHLKCHG